MIKEIIKRILFVAIVLSIYFFVITADDYYGHEAWIYSSYEKDLDYVYLVAYKDGTIEAITYQDSIEVYSDILIRKIPLYGMIIEVQ